MRKKTALISVVAMGLLLLAGCGKSSSSNDTSKITGKITIVGSTALQPLVEKAAETYQDDHSGLTIGVQGGGSGTGLSQVSTGAVTVGNSDIFAEQKDGVDAKKIVDHKVAVVGIAPVVNKETKVTNLSKSQLADIFLGKVTNWKALGGADQEIVVINRASGSGTRTVFDSIILPKQTAKQTQEQDSNGTVQKMVASTPGAISYLAFSYLNDNVQALSIDKVQPTSKNVENNNWKIWSYEHMYTKGSPKYATAKFISYIQSEKIQNSLIKKLGYISISDMQVEKDAKGNIEEINK
ncbi:phosphate ABC transporter substrate-binding protein PstS family protein [Dellaglioa algida]|uniref:Phosphate-binding protein n=1 Tax=Dellaglioa algida TaxID=105612 RepID=A0A5C6MB03_9LACO|nr:phosphate ABC transporter substrate-binding protein PstS family protein [Dellaglioa algida]MDK1716044.1 phosphate ABC transporter substrate-binding protein PstS family protein [Dellaglioa algida]MDK1719325.1 phosphate ABC transporter substrate-binding protein PstS family protein [Dellaglioa algida]MDK1721173.1 phosphate ABC transporter substrate-binding protein PstS family protein [Dellaglioa algida]MDK1722668.1 phosphate ABC transporter substrate-binding protein PstS family protein [Dellagl